MQCSFMTSRLQLLPVSPADVDALFAVWREPEVRRYLFDDEPVDRERTAEVVQAFLGVVSDGLGLWTLRARDERTIIGCVGLSPVDAAAEYDPTLRGLIEPVAALSPAHWGRGYADEALAALVAYALGPLGLGRMAGVTDLPNAASHRMLARLGFTVTGECAGKRHPWRLYILDRETFVRHDAGVLMVRGYRPDDAVSLMRLMHDTVHTVCRADYTSRQLEAWSPAAGLDAARWRERFARTRPWVAVADAQPVGFLELLPDGLIDCCYVHHQHQRRRVGTALMAHAFAEARAHGMARLFAAVSLTALPFFSRHGFTVVRPQDVERNGVTLRNLAMEHHFELEEAS